jgi:hypothetical protein
MKSIKELLQEAFPETFQSLLNDGVVKLGCANGWDTKAWELFNELNAKAYQVGTQKGNQLGHCYYAYYQILDDGESNITITWEEDSSD